MITALRSLNDLETDCISKVVGETHRRYRNFALGWLASAPRFVCDRVSVASMPLRYNTIYCNVTCFEILLHPSCWHDSVSWYDGYLVSGWSSMLAQLFSMTCFVKKRCVTLIDDKFWGMPWCLDLFTVARVHNNLRCFGSFQLPSSVWLRNV